MKLEKNVSEIKVDDLDRRILSELVRNSKRSLRNLARELGVHPATLGSRISKLEKNGIIKGYTVSLDYEKLGYDYLGIVEIIVAHGALLKVQENISKIPNVYAVFDVTGESDSIVIVFAKNRQHFSNFIKSILAMKDVVRTNTHVCLNLVKLGSADLL